MLTAERTIPTTCPYCGVGCQIDLHIREDVIIRVTGRYDNQVNFGNLCVKGRFGCDYVHAPDRLAGPLMRRRRDEALLHHRGVDEVVDINWGARRRSCRAHVGPVRLPRCSVRDPSSEGFDLHVGQSRFAARERRHAQILVRVGDAGKKGTPFRSARCDGDVSRRERRFRRLLAVEPEARLSRIPIGTVTGVAPGEDGTHVAIEVPSSLRRGGGRTRG